MTEIIGVRFKSGGKQYYFDPNGIQVEAGQGVIIETSRGIEYGECVQANTMVEDDSVVQPLRPLVRVATEKDLATVRRNKEREERAFRICQEKIAEHGLDMKLVEVEYNFDGNKILFFFTSEGRVDFRALVKDLASIFHTRIELRQIGVRDEAKMLGGLGICGRPFCCCGFLDDFQPVSIKMAKTQNLSLNPSKISGTCGRLMCCLKYEQEAYEDAMHRMPKNDSFVETPDGVGNVTSVNLLKETVKVKLDDQPEAPKCYHNCEICVVRNGKGKRPEGYVPPSPEELAKRRREVAPTETEEDRLAAALASLSSIMEPAAPAPAPAAPQGGEAEGEKRPPRRRPTNGGSKPRKPAAPAEGAPQQKQGQGRQNGQNRPGQPRQNPPKPRAPRPAGDQGQNRPAGQGGPKPFKPRPPRPAGDQGQNRPQAPAGAPAEGGAPKKPRRRYHRPHGGKPRGEGGGPAAPAN